MRRSSIDSLELSYTPSHEEIAHNADLLKELQTRLRTHAVRNAASTRSIRRALVLPSAPSLDQGEITDKGSINQRAVCGIAHIWLPHCMRLFGLLTS